MRALLPFVLCGCNAVWGIEPAGSTVDDSGTAPETENDPCAPESGVAKVCLQFEAGQHPSYDITTGAATHKIDGSGKLKILVFDKDPNDPAVPYTSMIQYPEGGEIKIDSFPVRIPLTLPAGRHWIIAQFEDNKAVSRVGENYYLPGDFVTVPGRLPNGKYVYPVFDAVLDQTAQSKTVLQPMRRVDVDLQADPIIRTMYKDYAVTGDGPVLFLLFDGAFTTTTTFLEFVSTHCVEAQPMSLTPPSIKTGFVTAVTGTHNIVASLEDYLSVGAPPTTGSLLTPSDTMIPTVAIVNTSWTASTSLKFVKVFAPVRATDMMDTQHCP
jgi:hypothetical protein